MPHKSFKVTVQKYPPPLPLAWAFLPAGRTPAAQLHKAHFRAIWRSLTFPGIVKMVLLLLAWPLLLAPRIFAATSRNWKMVKARVGKGPWRQVWEQFLLAAQFGYRPNYYYTLEFFRPEQRRLAGEYIHRYAVKDTLYRRLKGVFVSPLTGKADFARYCQERGLPVQPIVASLVNGKIEGNLFGGLPAKLHGVFDSAIRFHADALVHVNAATLACFAS